MKKKGKLTDLKNPFDDIRTHGFEPPPFRPYRVGVAAGLKGALSFEQHFDEFTIIFRNRTEIMVFISQRGVVFFA